MKLKKKLNFSIFHKTSTTMRWKIASLLMHEMRLLVTRDFVSFYAKNRKEKVFGTT